jgi:serine/threonine protein kinase
MTTILIYDYNIMKFFLMNRGKTIYFRSIHGGKPIIGKGVEGVVLKPDIIHHNDNYITKLFILPENRTIDEFRQLEINLNTFDGSNQYHLPMIDIGVINETHNLTELAQGDRAKYTYIATYEYGGLSLTNLIENPIYEPIMTPSFCINILNGFINLFNGIIHFSSQRINHNDIHSSNIVFVLDNPSMMRFIDFNLDTPLSDFNMRRFIDLNQDSPLINFNMRYVQDIIDILGVMEEIIHKFTNIFIEKKNEMFTQYFRSILSIVDKSVETLFRRNDINDIPIIVQTLKEKFDEIKPMISDE